MKDIYKKELLSQEYRHMNLETAMEYYPELIKKFRKVKEDTLNSIELSINKKFRHKKSRNMKVYSNEEELDKKKSSPDVKALNIIDKIKNINDDQIDYLAEVCTNVENLPYLYIIDILDKKVRHGIITGSSRVFNSIIKFTDWCYSEDKYYGTTPHRWTLQFMYTIREFVKLSISE